jgi:hypothetical protein
MIIFYQVQSFCVRKVKVLFLNKILIFLCTLDLVSLPGNICTRKYIEVLSFDWIVKTKNISSDNFILEYLQKKLFISFAHSLYTSFSNSLSIYLSLSHYSDSFIHTLSVTHTHTNTHKRIHTHMHAHLQINSDTNWAS